MRIIKLDATDSTNAYLKNAMQTEVLDDYTIVIAREQIKGKGQRGTSWQSEAGKNLTISVLKRFTALKATDQFVLSMAVSIGVYNALYRLKISNLKIKWPNDILSGRQKICGILIENVMQDSFISAAIIGIGLNVNQQNFKGIKGATSLHLQAGKPYNLEEVFSILVEELKTSLANLVPIHYSGIRKKYELLLFRKDQPSTFKSADGKLFPAYVRGVSDSGKLRLEIEDQLILEFDLKEIQMMY